VSAESWGQKYANVGIDYVNIGFSIAARCLDVGCLIQASFSLFVLIDFIHVSYNIGYWSINMWNSSLSLSNQASFYGSFILKSSRVVV
jgi:hypothetical protein